MQTVGMNLLSSVIFSKNIREYDRFKPIWFNEYKEESDLYEYLGKFIARYNKLPSIETVETAGFEIYEPVESIAYYKDEIDNRYAANVARGVLEELETLILDMSSGDQIRSFLLEKAHELDKARAEQSVHTFEELLERYRDIQVETRFKEKGLGIYTGFEPIDSSTNGFMPGEQLIISGNEKVGKSWLWGYIISNMWAKQGNPTMICSMEMDSMDEYATAGTFVRMISLISGLNPAFLRKGKLPNRSLDHIAKSVKRYKDRYVIEENDFPPLYFIDGTFNKGLSQIASSVRDFSPTVVGIDSIYLMEPEGVKGYIQDHSKLKLLANQRKRLLLDTHTIGVDTIQLNRGAVREEKVMTDNVGGTSAWSQNVDLMVAFRPVPDVKAQRQIVNIAGRNLSTEIDFLINFKFNPIDFSVIGDIDTSLIPESEQHFEL